MRHTPPSLSEFKQKRRKIRNVNQEFESSLKPLDRLALVITERVGTIGFFLCIALWTTLWLGWNLMAPPSLQFDPPMSFAFWLFISNLIQILLMPLIMVGQNIQGRHANARAENDLDINTKAEEEIELVLQHLEYQNSLLNSVLEKLGSSPGKAPTDANP